LRREHPALATGSVRFVGENRKHYLGYVRQQGDERFFVECNLSAQPLRRHSVPGCFEKLLTSDDTVSLDGTLRPYQGNVYRILHC
ncbi:MAG: alpha-glucosidase C-terminal domain-containing protein, partial [Propionibacteriaceae bacterium]|nr:alpha-glucosidase C-terminal domain-containing protein [Propionibacteriaceae bacterium]